ncbi:M4 family metallopeptidase [Streptomyces sp. NPDC020141]|uniref:M4 family metallopeptidase n=1 Tax=Streptomyces sp. NPDC020141 TaxID=3365065 RepID=UPI0037A5D86C
MRRPPFKASAAAALLASGALLAVALPAGPAGIASAATVSAAVPEPRARAGAEPARLTPADHAELLADARADRARTARAIGLGGAETLLPGQVLKDADGTLHTRYERAYRGLPVLGGDLVVHTAPSGAVEGVTRARARISLPTTTPARGAAEARAGSLARAEKDGIRDAVVSDTPRTVVWAAAGRPVLAHESVVEGVRSDGVPSELHVITDASTGAELYRYEGVKRGTGYTQYSGQVSLGTLQYGPAYSLVSADHGVHRTYDMNHGTDAPRLFTDADNIWGDGTPGHRQTPAADAAHGAQVTWDYYKDVHARYGPRNDGESPSSRVNRGHFNGAYWQSNCFCVSYGNGNGVTTKVHTSVDLAAHELTHALTAETAKLAYTAESQGLNEATSDILATGAEFHAANPVDKGDYRIGERLDLHGDGTPLRHMDRPARDGRSPNYWYPGIGTRPGDPGPVGATASPGPANHWFYLISEGSGAKTVDGVAYDSPTVDGLPVTPIGRAAAAKIWYRALTVYMISTTDYAGARAATLSAAADLYGASSAAHRSVMDAWAAVNVGARYGNPAPRPPGPVFENVTDVPIPDAPGGGALGTPAVSPIDVAGVAEPGIVRVHVDIVHQGRLSLELVAPDGTVYWLKDQYDLTPLAADHDVDVSAEAAGGTWSLRARDTTAGGVSLISGWKLTF